MGSSLCLLCLTVISASPSAADPVTTGSLLAEMIDLKVLANTTADHYTSYQFSSYDRRSTAPYEPDWFANSDGFGGEPIPNVLEVLVEPDAGGVGRYLLAQVDGPGALVRTWTPNPGIMNGTLAVYLDGSTEPVYDGPAGDFLRDRPACFGNEAPEAGTAFLQEDANYFPMPFSLGFRVEWAGEIGEIHFYHIGVRRYAPGTKVITFSPGDIADSGEEIGRVREAMAAPDAWWGGRLSLPESPFEATAQPGETVILFEADGPGLLSELGMRVEGDNPKTALRQMILRGHFDGSTTPQIEVPVGDFFATFPGIVPYDSLPMTVRQDGTMICRFVMPYARSATFSIRNNGDTAVKVTGWRRLEPGETGGGQSQRHFHAKWRVDHQIDGADAAQGRDLPYLVALGRGTLVGASVHLINTTPYVTGGGSWWGEGDEKIWVDDDPFPVFFGTGSEDYFNYSWGRNTRFVFGYCAQPVSTGPACGGYVTNLRWHVLDPISFNKSLGFYMELLHHSAAPEMSYARTAYYYAPPQTRDDTPPITLSDLRLGLDLPLGWQPVSVDGPAVFIQAAAGLAPDQPQVTVVRDGQWSDGTLVRWTPNGAGDTLPLQIDVPEAGKYQVILICAMTPDSGRFSIALNDQDPLGHVADLHTPLTVLSRTVPFGELEIEAGPQTIHIIAVDQNPESDGNTVGIDCFWLVPKP